MIAYQLSIRYKGGPKDIVAAFIIKSSLSFKTPRLIKEYLIKKAYDEYSYDPKLHKLSLDHVTSLSSLGKETEDYKLWETLKSLGL
jgi:hypothetical protein